MNEKAMHTPGPWGWVIHDHSLASLGPGRDPGLGDSLVLSVSPCKACQDRADPKEWQWGRCCTPSEANAALIAAAPELLEALHELRSAVNFRDAAVESGDIYQIGRAVMAIMDADMKAQAAISRATQTATAPADAE